MSSAVIWEVLHFENVTFVLFSFLNSSAGIYSFHQTVSNVLPIELTDFDAQLLNDIVHVHWE
jgi:hypothetical protein